INSAITSRLLRVRSPLLPESRLISVPRATEMFQFARFAPRNLCIQLRVPSKRKVGCPIRRPTVQRLFVSSPQLFADYHVLRRLSSPRHPPYALSCLIL